MTSAIDHAPVDAGEREETRTRCEIADSMRLRLASTLFSLNSPLDLLSTLCPWVAFLPWKTFPGCPVLGWGEHRLAAGLAVEADFRRRGLFFSKEVSSPWEDPVHQERRGFRHVPRGTLVVDDNSLCMFRLRRKCKMASRGGNLSGSPLRGNR